MIEKPAIIVTSLGRTGTEFLARLFADIIPDCTSLHEPDTVRTRGPRLVGTYFEQVRRAGIWRMLVLKLLGKWSLVQLSHARFRGELDAAQATKQYESHRRSFISEMPGSAYAEAHLAYYGLLDILPFAFRHHRAAYIVRDGRDWVRSHMNWGEFYGKRGLRKWLGHNMPSACDTPHDDYFLHWDDLSRFERLCWAWSRLNGYALEHLSENPHARLFRFEQIFLARDRYDQLKDLVGFATSLPGLGTRRIGLTDGSLEHPVHASSSAFPAWDRWTNEQKRQFGRICGPLMDQLGYRF